MRRPIYPNGSGGGSGDFVSLTTFDTYAELDAQAAEDGNLGLVASGTEGEPRLFRYATDTWIPDEPTAWTVATTGAGVMSGLIDAAGAAVYPGDLGIDGNATVYYAVGAAGRCAFVPRSLSGGVILGETHTASLVAYWYKEDPSTATDTGVIANGASSVTFDSGTGATTLQASSADGPIVTLGTTPLGGDITYAVLLGATFSGNRTGPEGGFEIRPGASSPYDRVRLFAEVSGTYAFGTGAGAGASLTGSDPSAEHDVAMSWDGTTARGYYNNPDPAQDSAVPAPDGSGNGTPTTTTSGNASIIFASADASTPSLVCDGAYIVTLTAIP